MTNLVRECFGYDFPDILTKRQVGYIFNYLNRLSAKTVLLEFQYVDKDFLEDFSRYYAKRYGNDGHKCARMHFFASALDHGMVSEILAGGPRANELVKTLQANYLGFMVIKPLPKTFIGKTCLKVMEDESTAAKRKRRLSRKYKVDLFGISLSVESLAFQEQDKVIAACATTAIWSALHALQWHSIRSVHSCSEITMNALNDRSGSSNSFPNTELNAEQMLRSIDSEGLRHHQENLRGTDEKRFFETVVSHIDSQLPLIFIGDVYSLSGPGKKRPTREGNHAICIVGYKQDHEKILYIHDDRLGPYVRAKLIPTAGYSMKRKPMRESWALALQTMNENGTWSDPVELIEPDVLIVPTDKKVRLPFYFALETCDRIKKQVALDWKTWFPSEETNVADGISFRIRLREISHIRQEVIGQNLDYRTVETHPTDDDVISESTEPLISKEPAEQSPVIPQSISEPTSVNFEDASKPKAEPHAEEEEPNTPSAEETELWQKEKVKFLTKGFARFQWEAQFLFNGLPIFKVFIDATDVPQGDAVSAVFTDNLILGTGILKLLRWNPTAASFKAKDGQFFPSFMRRLVEVDASVDAYLEETYGGLRAPLYLKAQEIQGQDIFNNPTAVRLYDAPRMPIVELNKKFASRRTTYLIWAVAKDGALLIGKEFEVKIDGRLEKCGHPSITAFQPARIAGEMHKIGNGTWQINAKSGRYSGDYPNRGDLLQNALYKFQQFFPTEEFIMQPADYRA
ncbi:hypothetical protein [Pseudomonas sp. PDM11]|uniref:hypothetical protein n=1 Tax=Pseudomonas sp. PDM11 TaxID=2769309 RepID=UPI0017838D1E|nr:hypothetical protein [Pseudomonas sp. PDM11]MBD9400082.1 hypothetical protein [Pseudomonas sp. PDM11]